MRRVKVAEAKNFKKRVEWTVEATRLAGAEIASAQ
jgi:hypothetical protein